MTTIPETGLVHDLDDAPYRAAPGLSSTGVKLMLDSPARYRWTMDHPTPPKTAFDIGIAVHALILGAGLDVEVIDADDWRSKTARDQRDDVRRRGLIPLLTHEWDQVAGMRDAVLANDDARTLLELPGDSEVSAFWDDAYTGVELKGRFDRLASGAPLIIDLKSTALSARPASLRAYAARYGWGEQAVHYKDGAWAATGQEHRFIHVACEVAPPHLVSVLELDADFLTIAEQRRRHAIDVYAHCVETDTWAGYGAGIHRVPPPRWFDTTDLEEDPA